MNVFDREKVCTVKVVLLPLAPHFLAPFLFVAFGFAHEMYVGRKKRSTVYGVRMEKVYVGTGGACRFARFAGGP